MSGSVIALVNHSKTAAKAWSKLETSFANHSSTHKLTLLNTLMNVTKEDKLVADYLQTLKGIMDDLTMVGHILSDKEVIHYTLNGLGSEFKEIVAAIRAYDSPLSYEKLYEELVDHKIYLKREETK